MLEVPKYTHEVYDEIERYVHQEIDTLRYIPFGIVGYVLTSHFVPTNYRTMRKRIVHTLWTGKIIL